MILSIILCKYHITLSRFVSATDLLAAFFMVIGYAYKKAKMNFEKYCWISILLGVFIVALGVEFWPCAMLKLEWWKISPYSFSALAGTIMVISLCKWIIEQRIIFITKFLSYAGDKTLEILTWHFLCFKIGSLIIIALYSLPMTRLAEFPVIEELAYKGWWLLYFIIGISLPLAISFGLSNAKKLIIRIYKTAI